MTYEEFIKDIHTVITTDKGESPIVVRLRSLTYKQVKAGIAVVADAEVNYLSKSLTAQRVADAIFGEVTTDHIDNYPTPPSDIVEAEIEYAQAKKDKAAHKRALKTDENAQLIDSGPLSAKKLQKIYDDARLRNQLQLQTSWGLVFMHLVASKAAMKSQRVLHMATKADGSKQLSRFDVLTRTSKSPFPNDSANIAAPHRVSYVPWPSYTTSGLSVPRDESTSPEHSIFTQQSVPPSRASGAADIVAGVNIAQQQAYRKNANTVALEAALTLLLDKDNAKAIEKHVNDRISRRKYRLLEDGRHEFVSTTGANIGTDKLEGQGSTAGMWRHAVHQINYYGSAYIKIGIDSRGRQYPAAGVNHYNSGFLAAVLDMPEVAKDVLKDHAKGNKRLSVESLVASVADALNGDPLALCDFFSIVSESDGKKCALITTKLNLAAIAAAVTLMGAQ